MERETDDISKSEKWVKLVNFNDKSLCILQQQLDQVSLYLSVEVQNLHIKFMSEIKKISQMIEFFNILKPLIKLVK